MADTLVECCLDMCAEVLMGVLFSSCKRSEAIPNKYATLELLNAALKAVSFEVCDVVLAIDFTRSNSWKGAATFGGKDLHTIAAPPKAAVAAAGAGEGEPGATAVPSAPDAAEGDKKDHKEALYPKLTAATTATVLNPYETVLGALSTTLRILSQTSTLRVVGFGDTHCTDEKIFCMSKRARGNGQHAVIKNLLLDGEECKDVNQVLNAYRKAVPNTVCHGPTSFEPVIRHAVEMTQQTGRHCMVLIVGDGNMDDVAKDSKAIIDASKFPVTISMVGVGDGPWDTMETFDDELSDREFDNFQFVNFHKLMNECGGDPQVFARHVLQEMPTQIAHIKRLRLLGKKKHL